MKKTLTVLMMVLLAAMLFISCDNNTSNPKKEESSTTPTTPAKKTINITYDLDGGTLADGVTNPATATEGETVTPTGPTRSADTEAAANYSIDAYLYCDSCDETITYTFKGWKVDGADDSTAATTYTAGTEDIKLVAVWDTTSTATNCSAIKLKDTVNVGTTVTLGAYNNSDLTWKVLAVETTNKKALLFATNVIKTMKNSSSSDMSADYVWTSSPIYEWFNNTGTEGFLSQCGLTNVSMIGSSDKVFLLSYDELVQYLQYDSAKACGSDWWLRTQASMRANCQYVTSNGKMINNKVAVADCGVRPAFWISL